MSGSAQQINTPSSMVSMGLLVVEKPQKLLMRGGADLSPIIPVISDRMEHLPSPKNFNDDRQLDVI